MTRRRAAVVAAVIFLSLGWLGTTVCIVAQHEARNNRTWYAHVNFLTCGDVEIVRVDRGLVDSDTPSVAVSREPSFVLQWNFQPPEGPWSMMDALIAMSEERYMVRVFLRTPTGTGIKQFYFSPYGGSQEKMPPLPIEALEDPELLWEWMLLHDYSPPSEYNPRRGAFNVQFPKLAYLYSARMTYRIQLDGPGCDLTGPPIEL